MLVANEWKEQVAGLGLEIEHRNYSIIDAQAPSPPIWDQEKQGCDFSLLKAERRKTYVFHHRSRRRWSRASVKIFQAYLGLELSQRGIATLASG